MRKRILEIFLAISVLLTMQTGVFAEKEKNPEACLGFGYEHEVQSEKPLFLMDFEEYTLSRASSHGFDRVPGGAPYPTDGVMGGTAFAIAGGATPYIMLEKPITEGMYLLSFDIRRSALSQWCYLRMNWNAGTTYDSFAINQKNAGHNASWKIQGEKEIGERQWHHVNMYLDFDRDKIYYYIDNEYITEASGLPDLHKLQFMIQGEPDLVTSIDNFVLFPFTVDLRRELTSLSIEMPESYRGDFLLEIGSKYDGNLFTNFEELELDVTVTNKLESDGKYDLSYYAAGYDGDVVWSGEQKELSIGGNETVVHKVKPAVDRYDIYTLYVTVTSYAENSEPVLKDKEFSVAHAPTPGYKSDYIGACTHPGRWTRWNKIKHAAEVAGIGYFRTDYAWQGYEPEIGVYGGKGEAERFTTNFYREARETGMEHIIIFHPENKVYGVTAKTLGDNPEAVLAYEKAAENFAREYKGVIDVIELGNEYGFARQEDLTPEEAAVFCAAAYRGIKRGNPDATVLTHGLSRSAGDWLYRHLTALDEPICDAVAVHLYQEAGTPESKKFDEYVWEVKNAMIRAGCGDMELWLTEGNTSAHKEYSTEQQHGVNLVRQFAYCQAYDLLDKFIFYQFQTDEARPNDIESYFGIIRGPNVNNANAPKQTYMALTNFIAMTESAEHDGLIQYDNVWIHRYKKENGSNILMMYADRDCKLASLSLGAESGIMYDVNGNAVELRSDDGKYVFSLSDQPVYFEYTGNQFERCEDLVVLDKDMLEGALGNVDSFHLTLPENCELLVQGNDKLQAEKIQNETGADIRITVKALPEIVNLPGVGNVANVDYTERRQDFGTQLYRDYVDVTVKRNGAQYALIRLPVEYKLKAAKVSMRVKPYDNTNTKYWVGVVRVHNNTTEPLSGTIRVTEPAEIAGQIEEIPVEKIQPGEAKEVTYNIPAEFCHGYHKYGGVFVTEGGEEVPFLLGDHPESYWYRTPGSCAFGVIEKTKEQTPVIDGVIDEAEWKGHKITNFDKSQVSYGSQGIITAGVVEGESFGKDADYGGQADFSGTIYAQWDDRYFYAAAIVYDDIHWQKQEPVRFYYDDCFYLCLQPTHSQRHDTRIDFALSDYFNHERFTEEERHGEMYRNWSQMFDVCVGGVMEQSEDGCQVKINRKEKVTIYEARVPLTEIYSPEVLAMKPVQSELSLNIRDYDGDRDKTFGWGGWFVLADTKTKTLK